MSQRLPPHVATVVEALSGLKGHEILVLDLRGLTDATDWFVIASGTSDTHVRGLADAVTKAMQPLGHRPHHRRLVLRQRRRCLRRILLSRHRH